MSHRWFLIFVLSAFNVTRYLVALTVVPGFSNSNSNRPLIPKNHVSMTFTALLDERAFFGRWDEGCAIPQS